MVLSLLAHSLATAGLPEGREAFDKQQYSEARKELIPLAEEGQAEAMAYVGEMLMRGQGGPRDELKAQGARHRQRGRAGQAGR